MLLFETTTDPALRRVYAMIDYAANHAAVEICDIALDAYNETWGRIACEKPACLRSYERQSVAQHQLAKLLDGILRHPLLQVPRQWWMRIRRCTSKL